MIDHNLRITGVTIKNFLSVGNATQALKLDEHGLTLVLGNNGDSNGVPTKNGAGKCLPSYTELQNVDTGEWASIKDWYERFHNGEKIRVQGLDSDLKLRPTNVIDIFTTGRKKIFTVDFASHGSVNLSDTHPVYTATGCKPVKDLAVGEWVAAPRQLQSSGKADYSNDEIIVISALMAEGSLTSGGYGFTNSDSEIINRVNTALLSFNSRLVRQGKSDYDYRIVSNTDREDIKNQFMYLVEKYNLDLKLYTTNYHQIIRKEYMISRDRLYDMAQETGDNKFIELSHKYYSTYYMKRLFVNLGLDNTLAKNKRLPLALFKMTDEQIRLFLQFFYACDGYVSTNRRVELGLASEGLIDDISKLWLRLGVVTSKVYKSSRYDNSKSFDSWRLNPLGRQSLYKMCDILLGLPSSFKNNRIQTIITELSSMPINDNKTCIPSPVYYPLIENAVIRTGKPYTDCNHQLFFTKRQMRKHAIGSDKLLRYANYYKDDDLKKLVDSDIIWVQIKDIRDTGYEEDTYDITVDNDTHLYALEKIITHNSSILQAISYGLYGQPLTKIKIPNLVNNINGKAMHVVIDFERAGIKYRVERGQAPKIMKYYIDGAEIKNDKIINDTKGENAETQADINRVIGMTHTMFKHIVALNTYTEPFLKLPAAKQREFIEELLGVTQISNRADKLKAMIAFTKDRVKTLEAHISATKAANKKIEESIDKARVSASAWEKHQENLIQTIRNDLITIENFDADAELKIFDAIDLYKTRSQELTHSLHLSNNLLDQKKRSIKEIENALSRNDNNDFGESSIARIERDIVRQKAHLENLKNDLLRDSEQVSHFEELLENPGEQDCKTCGQALQGTDHLQYVIKRFEEERDKNVKKVEHNKTSIEQAEAEIKTLENEISSIKKNADILRLEVEAEKLKLTNELDAISIEIPVIMTEKAAIESEITALNGCPTSAFNNRDEVYAIKQQKDSLLKELERLEDEDNPHIGQINGLRTAIQQIDMEPINKETETLKHQEFLFKLLTSKDSFIRRKIIDQNLAFLNNRLNQYLNKMGLPHEVIFLSDLSVDITLLGRDMDYDQLSRGESNRVIMAMSWAFRDVWESLNHRVNLYFLDEILDSGLDSSGAESALQILKSYGRNGRNVYLISHRDELIGRIDRTLLVSKENGFTSFSEE